MFWYTYGMIPQRWNKWIPWIGFGLALLLRLWHLGTPAQIVSDEISFVNDGRSYVAHQMYFDTHPPLGKLEIGLAIKYLGDYPVAWRIVSAVSGALMMPLIWWVAWRLTKKQLVAALAMVLALLDGLMLVDSRLGLINMSYILASVGAFACVLKALSSRRSLFWLCVGGTLLGMALATKWLAVLVGIPMLILWLWPQHFGQPQQQRSTQAWLFGLSWLVLWPMIVYWLVFLWHFSWLGIPISFFEANMQMLNYQLSVPPTGDPYSQPWWGWLLAWRPFPYWIETLPDRQSIMQSLPNPWIWWSGSVIFLTSLVRGWRNMKTRLINILLLFAWIPFAFIHRVMYSYHALLFDVWLLILIAIFLEKFWDRHRGVVLAYLAMAVVVFIWIAPWYLNVPLSPSQQKLRQWLPTWSVKF